MHTPRLVVLLISLIATLRCSGVTMSYESLMVKGPAALSVHITSIDAATGKVTANGAFTAPKRGQFSWHWGDGKTNSGSFPQTHTYAKRMGAYEISVAAADTSAHRYEAFATVRFTAATVSAHPLPPELAVTIPAAPVDVVSTMPGYRLRDVIPAVPGAMYPPAVLEHVLTAAAVVEDDLVGDDIYKADGTFRQVMLAASGNGNAYSVWYTSPVAFVAHENFFSGTPVWSSLLHEMGHNFTLNMPASYRFGGKTDGPANAIYSESLAQIFQHVAAYVLVTHASEYGIPDDLACEVRESAYQSFGALRSHAEQVRSGAKPFVTWNDPSTRSDEALPTFMCLGYEFFGQSKPDGSNYVTNAKRLCAFLRHFNPAWHAAWDPKHDTASATTFRSTLMIAALSHGVGKDLRPVFKTYGFAVDDDRYATLMSEVDGTPATMRP